jgi:ribosomal-protein-alanine N-acetyltransferase
MINKDYFEEFPKLETPRLILRKQEFSDAVEVKQIRSDERVMLYMDSKRHTSIEIAKQFVAENVAMYDNQKGLFWALIEKKSGLYIGDFAFFDIDYKNARTEIGYTLKPEFWKKGLMKEAMQVIFNFGFNKLNLHSLEANINPGNTNSRNILTKMGFKKEAYFRENYFFNGQFLDSEIYSLLGSDFLKQNQL